MKKIKNSFPFFLIFLVMFFVFSSLAAAQPNNYIVGKFGGYSPASNDLTGFDTDFNGELAFGHYFNRNFATEFGVGHLQTSGTVCLDINCFTLGTQNIDATYIDGTAKLVFPFPYYYPPAYNVSSGDLYVGGGVGVYFVHDNLLGDATTPGGHILGGADFNITREVFLGLEAKYIFLKPFDQPSTDMEGFIFSRNIGYRF